MRATPINNTRGGAVTAPLVHPVHFPLLHPFLFSSSRRFHAAQFRPSFSTSSTRGGRGELLESTTTRPPIIPSHSTLPMHSTARINSPRTPSRHRRPCQASSPFIPSFPSSSSSSFATLLLLFCNGVKRREKAKTWNDQRTVTHKCRSINLAARSAAIGSSEWDTEFDFATWIRFHDNDSLRNANNFLSRPARVPFSTPRSPSLQI